MVDYKKLYAQLFNSMTDAIELLEKQETEKAKELLISAQQAAEDEYIDTAE